MNIMKVFKPVSPKVISPKTYGGTCVPKLTDEQVAYARKLFSRFLSNLAKHGMKFDYNHMDGGFYVRDFRLGWACDPEVHDDEAVVATRWVFSSIVSDGCVDICDEQGSQLLPDFASESDGFTVDLQCTETLPY